ncbi:NAD(P)H-dependent glycerol-3-phosphate dehydrogenase [Candidatus Auribacterota bacterium]
MKRKIVVLGDGGWGTTLSILLNQKGEEVTLWGIFPEYISLIKEKRENPKFLPNIKISASIQLTSDIKEALDDKTIIISTVPSQHFRKICKKIAPYLKKETMIISASKGIENDSLKRMSEVIKDELKTEKIVVLSGPSHAEETVKGCPTTVVAASEREELAKKTQELFISDKFRVYTHSDVIGVELGGSLKNVIAIAAGMCDGMDLGNNAKAALLTRAMVEITRLGTSMGAKQSTFFGLSGMGDLITTCVSEYGRNKRFGFSIAQGKSKDEILNETDMVVEGVATAKSVYALGKKYQVEMPITQAVYDVLFNKVEPKQAVLNLMTRSPKSEEKIL